MQRNGERSDPASLAMVDAQTWRCTALSGHPSLPLRQHVGRRSPRERRGRMPGPMTVVARGERKRGGQRRMVKGGGMGRPEAGRAWAAMVERALGHGRSGSGRDPAGTTAPLPQSELPMLTARCASGCSWARW